MNVKSTNPMADLYNRLRAVGLTQNYLKKTILPEWWDDEIAENPAGYAEGLTYLSRHLGLDLASLHDPSRTIDFREFGICKYKKSKDATEDQLALARAVASRVAQLAHLATKDDFSPCSKVASQIRGEILARGAAWVGLDELLDHCWSIGIPVLHISNFPEKPYDWPGTRRRPDGLAVRVEGRPVVVLCKKAGDPSWLSFILAHELGHIALGHIEREGVLVDESMDDNIKDEEEIAADNFAVELLVGSPNVKFKCAGRWPKAEQLAQEALQIGREKKIDPGHVVLNFAYASRKNLWPLAKAALALLHPEKNATEIVSRKMTASLDWAILPEDHNDFLKRICEGENPRDVSLRIAGA